MTKATEALENYKGRDENSPQKKAVVKATEDVAREDEAIESIIAQVFQLYSNLLTEEARRPWCKILGEQIDVPPGTTHMESNTPRSVTGLGAPSWTM